MMMNGCFCYEDIKAELKQWKDVFAVTLRMESNIDISMTLNYTQIKVLAEGLLALASQTDSKNFINAEAKQINGSMQIKFTQVENEIVEESCQQNISTALAVVKSLSKAG